jgi:hypothetical protein
MRHESLLGKHYTTALTQLSDFRGELTQFFAKLGENPFKFYGAAHDG